MQPSKKNATKRTESELTTFYFFSERKTSRNFGGRYDPEFGCEESSKTNGFWGKRENKTVKVVGHPFQPSRSVKL